MPIECYFEADKGCTGKINMINYLCIFKLVDLAKFWC